MEVNEQILKYIQNEKDISRYKISTLERASNISPSKKRILNIEREFLSIQFEFMDFEDVADVAAAISIYNTSRGLFYKTYNLERPKLYQVNKRALITSLNRKLDFIKQTGHTFAHIRVQELNLIQNSDFYYDFTKRQSIKNRSSIDFEERAVNFLNHKELLKMEPLTIAKKRARAQAVTYSIGRYLLDSSMLITISSLSSVEDLKELSEELDKIINNIKYNIFGNYNKGLMLLPSKLKNTMGQNPYLSKLHELQNVLEFSSLKDFGQKPTPISMPSEFTNQEPLLGNIFFGSKKAIVHSPSRDSERGIQNKVFGILIPIPRKGNEKMTLLYKRVIIDNIDISHLFADNFSNIKALSGDKEKYYKGVLMLPLWKVIEMATTDNASRYILSKIINFDVYDFENINFECIDMISKINEINSRFLKLSKGSVILTAKTRSEEEGISDIFSIINSKISEVKDDYFLLESTTNEIF